MTVWQLDLISNNIYLNVAITGFNEATIQGATWMKKIAFFPLLQWQFWRWRYLAIGDYSTVLLI